MSICRREPVRKFLGFATGVPALVAMLLMSAAVCATAADRPLAELVPADIGLCLEAEGLHEQVEQFLAGPLFRRWRAFPPLEQWRLEQRAHLVKFDQGLKSTLGVSWDDLRSRLFGHRWLLAVYAPQGADLRASQPPQGMLLVHAADADLLAKAAEKLLAEQRKSERYRRNSVVGFGDRSFTVHELEDEAKRPLFLTYDGAFGCLATSREKLEDVLRRRAVEQAADDGSLASSEEYRAAAKQRLPRAALRLFVQAKSWRATYQSLLTIEQGEDGANQPDAVVRKFAELWTHLKYLAADVELGNTLRLDVRAAWDDKALSPELRGLLKSQVVGPSPASTIPGDCLVAVSGRLDMKKLAGLVIALQRQEAERRGRKVPAEALLVARIAGGLGPGLTAYVRPAQAYAAADDERKRDPAATDGGPIEWVLGFDTQPVSAGEPSLADALDPLLRVALVLAADAYNAEGKRKALLETEQRDGMQITGLTGFGPFADAGFFMARRTDRLWFAGSPSAIAEAAGAKPESPLEENALFRRLRNPLIDVAPHLLFVNLREVRRTAAAVVAEPPPALAVLRSDAARRSYEEFNTLLSLADAVLLEAAVDERSARISLAAGVAAESP